MKSQIHLVLQITVKACIVSDPWNPFINVCNLHQVNDGVEICSKYWFWKQWDIWYESYYISQARIFILYQYWMQLDCLLTLVQVTSNIFKDKTPCFLSGFPIQTHSSSITFQFAQVIFPSPVHIDYGIK